MDEKEYSTIFAPEYTIESIFAETKSAQAKQKRPKAVVTSETQQVISKDGCIRAL